MGDKMIGQRLKELREEKKLTKRDMAKLLNIHETSYGKYELDSREPSLDMLKKIASYFNVSIDYLMETSNIKNPQKNQDMVVIAGKFYTLEDLAQEGKQDILKYVEFMRDKYKNL